ncbi:hypothetical protein [Marinimicrobium agarilyticum]|uniref:hypothetical protein n=1 Tax=Marinimicrobium TaxID=359337 RepID=UPI0012F6BA87|nr:hypothetical protein [Marinimicrobium agarilyticum]
MKIDSAFLDTETLIRAAESEDEVGTVLRMHLVLDNILDAFLREKITEAMRPYIKIPKYFGQKIPLVTAFGMPIPFVRALRVVNTIRNELAHNTKVLSMDHLSKLAQQVNLLSEIDPSVKPLNKRYIELPVARPGERITYGCGDLRLDFVIAAMAIIHAMVPWLAKQ